MRGPSNREPLARKLIDYPLASGASGPTIVRSIASVRANSETARQVLASGELGEIGQAQVDFRIHHDFRGSFRERMEQPLLLDMAVHSFDLIRFVTGLEMVDVRAHTWNPPWSQFDGDASALVLFTMDSGARVAYNGSWHPRGQFTDWNCRWLIECSRGYLTLDRDVVKVYRGDDVHHPGTAAEELVVPLVELERTDQAAVLVDFAAAIRDDRPAPTNAVDNLRTVEMVLSAVTSATLSASLVDGQPRPGRPPARSGRRPRLAPRRRRRQWARSGPTRRAWATRAPPGARRRRRAGARNPSCGGGASAPPPRAPGRMTVRSRVDGERAASRAGRAGQRARDAGAGPRGGRCRWSSPGSRHQQVNALRARHRQQLVGGAAREQARGRADRGGFGRPASAGGGAPRRDRGPRPLPAR